MMTDTELVALELQIEKRKAKTAHATLGRIAKRARVAELVAYPERFTPFDSDGPFESFMAADMA